MLPPIPFASAYPRDPSEMAFDLVVHVLLGVYLWEWFISLDFDWQYISRQKPFLWPMIFYFINRYFMLFSLVGIMIGVGVISKINCHALYNVNTFLGASAIGLASINLSLRTIAVWSRSWWIVVPLIVLIIGHFGLLLHAGVTITGQWLPGKGCITIYADGTVLMATLYKTGAHSTLRTLVFRDGLIYFIILFLTNVVATTIISLNRDPAISIITSPPSAVMSTIVACRVVRRLTNYSPPGPDTQPSLTHLTTVAFHSRRSSFSTDAVRTRGPDETAIRDRKGGWFRS